MHRLKAIICQIHRTKVLQCPYTIFFWKRMAGSCSDHNVVLDSSIWVSTTWNANVTERNKNKAPSNLFHLLLFLSSWIHGKPFHLTFTCVPFANNVYFHDTPTKLVTMPGEMYKKQEMREADCHCLAKEQTMEHQTSGIWLWLALTFSFSSAYDIIPGKILFWHY